MSTQWRVGLHGPVGLDYCAVYPLMERMQLTRAEWLDLLDDLRVMEQGAMAQLAENAENAKET